MFAYYSTINNEIAKNINDNILLIFEETRKSLLASYGFSLKMSIFSINYESHIF